MAQYRQSGAERFLSRAQHDSHPTAGGHRLRAARLRRLAGGKHRRPSAAVVITLALALALALTLLTFRLFSPKEIQKNTDENDAGTSQSEHRSLSDRSVRSKELKFGHGSDATGRDSRYWDRDDRRRDEDYREEDSQEKRDGLKKDRILEGKSSGKGQPFVDKPEEKERRGGLYNEGGRAELDSYKEEYEHSLNNAGQLEQRNGANEGNADDEYDDGIDVQDDHEDTEPGDGVHCDDGCGDGNGKLSTGGVGGIDKVAILGAQEKGSTVSSSSTDGGGKSEHGHGRNGSAKVSGSEKKSASKRKPKHHKFSSSSCEMKFLNSTAHLVEPVQNKKFARFNLQYTDVEDWPSGSEHWEPRFAGHQTLQEREESFYARDVKINCGFIKGPSGSPSTGFDLAEDDVKFMSSCHIAVSSCIFGNSDRLRSPFKQKITRLSRKNVCFVMFLDESTLQTLLSEGQQMDNGGYIGLWKIIVVKNLPYSDMRRVGKIPKFLTHRLFPSARYSIWMDSKLRLQSDPYLTLEYFLWRHGYEYAISNHYDRHCVWEEVIQNKKLNKFNHTIIDQQFEFYQSDGLKRFDPSDPNKLLPSYVPEGSFIVRAHTPMSNLFSCLWFNEVDRFTPRDQLSFAYTYLKLRRMNPEKRFHLSMFKDCERRSVAKLFHHRAEEKRDTLTRSIR